MIQPKMIWLASYPRSGNTLLRTILWQCLRLRSASVYPNDVEENKALENVIGHIERDPDGRFRFPDHAIPLIKTHEHPTDGHPAIYVVRDGRAASVSLWEFWRKELSLAALIAGQHRFGTWSDHVAAWKPGTRLNTVLVKYEDMITDLQHVLAQLSDFLGCKMVSTEIPDRDRIAAIAGRWVRKKHDWESLLTDDVLVLFNQINGNAMRRMGYVP